MDRELLIELGNSAQERGQRAHTEYQQFKSLANSLRGRNLSTEYLAAMKQAASSLNDSFYWFGHANAYKGIAMLMEREEVGT